ncbi:MAG TPA: hypothetical protein VHH34_00610, partial [Pseudonocardiaceae bacterium]|nr:hypothetical protein [Pseudonocardiaceae bacterium]
MVVAGLVLLVAALGEAVARLPADACERLVRSTPPRAPARQLLIGWSRCAAVLGIGTGTVATVLALVGPAWSWAAAATATAA